MRRLALLLVLLVAGCAGSRQITDLRGFIPETEARPAHKSVDTLLNHYFTSRSYALVKDIPLIDGPAFSGYAAGTTFVSNLASLVTLNGWGRKVIIPADLIRNVWGVECIIHEYVHHLDDMDRDGEAELLDLGEFRTAFITLLQDFKYAGLALSAVRKAHETKAGFFVIGELSEHVAYTAAQMAVTGKGPDYMWHVFRKILRRFD